jgi:hypothetical protein
LPVSFNSLVLTNFGAWFQELPAQRDSLAVYHLCHISSASAFSCFFRGRGRKDGEERPTPAATARRTTPHQQISDNPVLTARETRTIRRQSYRERRSETRRTSDRLKDDAILYLERQISSLEPTSSGKQSRSTSSKSKKLWRSNPFVVHERDLHRVVRNNRMQAVEIE